VLYRIVTVGPLLLHLLWKAVEEHPSLDALNSRVNFFLSPIHLLIWTWSFFLNSTAIVTILRSSRTGGVVAIIYRMLKPSYSDFTKMERGSQYKWLLKLPLKQSMMKRHTDQPLVVDTIYIPFQTRSKMNKQYFTQVLTKYLFSLFYYIAYLTYPLPDKLLSLLLEHVR
jgi:hypothetical protein